MNYITGLTSAARAISNKARRMSPPSVKSTEDGSFFRDGLEEDRMLETDCYGKEMQ